MYKLFSISITTLFIISLNMVWAQEISPGERFLLNQERELMREIDSIKKRMKTIPGREGGAGRLSYVLGLRGELNIKEDELRRLRMQLDYKKLRARLGKYAIQRSNLDHYLKTLKKQMEQARLQNHKDGELYYKTQIRAIEGVVSTIVAMGPQMAGLEMERVSGGGGGVRKFPEKHWFKVIWPAEGVNLEVTETSTLDDFNRSKALQFRVVVADPLSEKSPVVQKTIIVDLARQLDDIKAARDFEDFSKSTSAKKMFKGLMDFLKEAPKEPLRGR